MGAYDGPAPAPLIFRSSDLDEARMAIDQTYYTNFIDRLGPAESLDARFDVVSLGPLTIGDMTFGTDVRMRLGDLGAYHVDIPLSGNLSWRQGSGDPRLATPSRAAVFRPEGTTALDLWSADCRLLAVKIDQVALELHLERLLGRPVRKPLPLAPDFDISQGSGSSWARMLTTVVRDMQEGGGLLLHPLVAGRFQEALLSGLLLTAGHPYSEELAQPAPSLRPTPVKRVMDAIHERPEHPFTTAELAEIGRVGVRWLQEGFRRHVGVSPMAYLRDVRLCRVRDDLQNAEPGELSVSEAAYRWGFVHPGRFASSYRARFGEPPSQTLHTPRP